MRDLEAVAEEVFLAERLDSLKEVTEEVLARLSKEELFLLEYRYFRRKKLLAKFGEVLPCSERNYFRKQEKLLRKIAAQFSLNGVTEEYFLEAFKSSVCLMKVYGAIVKGGELKICARREKRLLRFQGSKFSGGADFLPCATKIATTITAATARTSKTILTAEGRSGFFAPAAGSSGSSGR